MIPVREGEIVSKKWGSLTSVNQGGVAIRSRKQDWSGATSKGVVGRERLREASIAARSRLS